MSEDKVITKADLLFFVEDLLKGILDRSCSSYYSNCAGEQIRGAIWLYTGKDPGRLFNKDDVMRVLDSEAIDE